MSLLPRRATPDPTHTIKPTAHNLARHGTPRSNALDPGNPTISTRGHHTTPQHRSPSHGPLNPQRRHDDQHAPRRVTPHHAPAPARARPPTHTLPPRPNPSRERPARARATPSPRPPRDSPLHRRRRPHPPTRRPPHAHAERYTYQPKSPPGGCSHRGEGVKRRAEVEEDEAAAREVAARPQLPGREHQSGGTSL